MISKCGSIESCDCLITLYEQEGITIDIDSSVIIQYGQRIKEVIEEVLSKHNIKNLKVVINDKGALDYTIKSRLTTALQRGGII